MRLPIRLRQLPRFAGNVLRRAAMALSVSPEAKTFRLCYFTCASYFRYLYCSVHSLSVLPTRHKLEILVFCDRSEMLSADQIDALEGLGLPVTVIPWGKSQGWGTEQIESIWQAYALAASDAPAGCHVARIDSDVFFFSSWIFDLVAGCSADLVGDGHFVDFEYCQGGVYFFRAEGIKRVLAKTPVADFAAQLGGANIVVEDVAAYFLAGRAGLASRLIFFMMFPDEYANAGRLSAYQRWKFACLHYARKDKRPMIGIYLEQLSPGDSKAAFQLALET